MAGSPAPLPWTGLDLLTSEDSVVTFEDFAYLTRVSRWNTSVGARYRHVAIFPTGIPRKPVANVMELDWSRRTSTTTGRACHTAIGRVLAKALNGMVVEEGQTEDLASADLGLRADIEGCLRLDSSRLPKDWAVTVSHAGQGYPQLILGRWYYYDTHTDEMLDNQILKMGGHRLMCWLVHGDPPNVTDKCLHLCDPKGKPWCCNPRHLIWGPHSLNHASSRKGGKRPRAEHDVV